MTTFKKVLKFLGLFSLGILSVVVGGWLVWKKIYVPGVLLIITGVYFISIIRIISGEKMGVVDTMGSLSFRDSGPCLVPWPFAKLMLYLKKTFFFTYELKEVVTRAGKRTIQKKTGTETEIGNEEIGNEEAEEKYGAQVLKVNFGVYLNFPREKRLLEEVKTEKEIKEIAKEGKSEEEIKKTEENTHPLIKIRRAEVPTDEKGLKEWIGGVVGAALREVLGNLTWEDTIIARKRTKEEVEKILKDPHEALVATGFSVKGIRFVVTEIDLPEGLKKAMPKVDQRRLEAKAAPFEAKQRARETVGAVMEMFCEEIGMERKEVEKWLRERPEEFVKIYKTIWEKNWDIIHRRMGIDGGAYLDIRSQNPIQDLLALWKRMPAGRRPTEPGEEKAGEKEKEESPHERVQRKYKELKKLFGRE